MHMLRGRHDYPVLQMKKLRLEGVVWRGQGHTASKG